MGVVICVHLPRFELVVACGGHEGLATRPLALVGAANGTPVVDEVSGAAQGAGVAPGMALAEALARCPQLGLVAADPLAVAHAWERVALGLEAMGAAVELARPGLAYFDAAGLLGLYGGLQGVIAAVRRALARPARIGAAPTRFCALAAAMDARQRRAVVVRQREALAYLASRPVELLGFRAQTAALVEPLGRLGVRTLGELAGLGADALADRFGRAGAIAWALASGSDAPPCPRRLPERLVESLALADVRSRAAHERALDVLLDRLLARPERRGRTLRALVLSARLPERGAWSERVVLRRALAEREPIRLALGLRLALLPAPAQELRLEAESFGPPCGEQMSLLDASARERRRRLAEAVRQLRALAGPEAALKVLPVEPASRIPERRYTFTPRLP
jgi:protein ImuB